MEHVTFSISALSNELSSRSDTGGKTERQLILDPESDYGYRIEESPWAQALPENFQSEEQLEPFCIYMYQPLSREIHFLYAVVAGVCLTYLLTRFLKLRLRFMKRKWAVNFLLGGIFFTILCHRWLGSLPANELIPLLSVLDAVLLFVVMSLFFQGGSSKKLYLTIAFLAIFELGKVLNAYGVVLLEPLCQYLGLPGFYLFPVYSRRMLTYGQ